MSVLIFLITCGVLLSLTCSFAVVGAIAWYLIKRHKENGTQKTLQQLDPSQVDEIVSTWPLLNH